MLARTYKDLWAASDDPRERDRCLERTFQCYREAYAISDGYYSGINAATTALLLGRRAESKDLAQRVRERCLELSGDPARGDAYWVLATLGEAALLGGEWPEAVDWYGRAAALARGRLGDLVSTRRNARLILRHLGAGVPSIEATLRVPKVAVCAGHLIDRPGRPRPRFPPALEGAVAAALRDRLRNADVGFAYASAGCGADILFLECLRELGAALYIVLPYDRDQFLHDSVAFVPDADWAGRYRRLLGEAAEVITASDHRMAADGALSYEYGFLMLDGAAALRADELDTDLISVAVWDGEPGDGPGGTASSVARWRAAGRPVEVIDLAALRARDQQPPIGLSMAPVAAGRPRLESASGAGGAADPAAFAPEIVGLFFADVAGFSRLVEEEIPRFVVQFLGTVAQEVARSPETPLLTNTWGDGLYVVFRSVRETGEFALRVSEVVRGIDWAARGLPDTLALRIGLHAGPAYGCLDPVTGRRNYLGSHVSRAARIEPITPPGEVYASGAFAAVARAEQVESFTCSYVGRMPLAKAFGTFPMYVVHRRLDRSPITSVPRAARA
jgi:class 3 adenylate cyclase